MGYFLKIVFTFFSCPFHYFANYSSVSSLEAIHKGSEVNFESGHYTKGMKLFQDAAELGDEKAAFAIGMLYDQGLGVKQDHAEAVKWYRKSANQGF